MQYFVASPPTILCKAYFVIAEKPRQVGVCKLICKPKEPLGNRDGAPQWTGPVFSGIRDGYELYLVGFKP